MLEFPKRLQDYETIFVNFGARLGAALAAVRNFWVEFQSPPKTAQKVLPEQAGMSKQKFAKSVRKLSLYSL